MTNSDINCKKNTINQNDNLFQVMGSNETSSFSDKLKLLIADDSIRNFAKKCNLSEGVVRKYLKNETEPTLKSLISISKANNVDIGWLAIGKCTNRDEGVMPISSPLNAVKAIPSLTSNLDDKDVGTFHLNSLWLKEQKLEDTNLALFLNVGDHMEPTIKNGDIALIDIKTEQWNKTTNGIFVIELEGELVIKRIQYDPIEKGFHIINDNSNYKSNFISFEKLNSTDVNIKIVAKVERILIKIP